MSAIYQPLKIETARTHHFHHIPCAVHTWGSSTADPVFLLHGWADTGTSFQFLVDAMSDDWYLIAPDWQGFGDSAWSKVGYWFPDYLAVLDALIKEYRKKHSVKLVGHSMGGNIACIYAGLRPARVSHLVNMEGFGLPNTEPGEAPGRYREWLDQKNTPQQFSVYSSFEEIARLIQKRAPHISSERALYIARQWGREDASGEIRLKADPAHKVVNPVLYRREEAKSCWREVTARTLLMVGKESRYHGTYFDDGIRDEFNASFRDLQETVVEHAGHMLHHDQPEQTARILEDFLHQ